MSKFAQIKKRLATTKQAINNKTLAKVVIPATLTLGAMSAHADLTGTSGVDVNDIAGEVADAKTPVAKIASASLGVYVALRVWKFVRRAI